MTAETKELQDAQKLEEERRRLIQKGQVRVEPDTKGETPPDKRQLDKVEQK